MCDIQRMQKPGAANLLYIQIDKMKKRWNYENRKFMDMELR